MPALRPPPEEPPGQPGQQAVVAGVVGPQEDQKVDHRCQGDETHYKSRDSVRQGPSRTSEWACTSLGRSGPAGGSRGGHFGVLAKGAHVEARIHRAVASRTNPLQHVGYVSRIPHGGVGHGRREMVSRGECPPPARQPMFRVRNRMVICYTPLAQLMPSSPRRKWYPARVFARHANAWG